MNSYKKMLVSEPFYSDIPEKYWEMSANIHDLQYIKKLIGKYELKLEDLYKACQDNPTVFAYWMLGFRLRPHQCLSMDMMVKHNRIAECWSRRMGKTFKNRIFIIWSTYFNKYPSISTGTTWNIVLQDKDVAQDLYMQPIYEMVENGDVIVKKNFKGWLGDNYFTDMMMTRKEKSGKVRSNQLSIKSKDGSTCRIFALPPTKKAIGREGNIIGDEVSKWKYNNSVPDDIQFYQQLKPILIDNPSFKGIFTSTPEGPDDLFAYIFNPYNELDKEQEYQRLWLPYTARQEQQWIDAIDKEREKHIEAGTISTFQQEFEAKFVQTENMFFTSKHISSILDSKLKQQRSNLRDHCFVGIDWGGSTKSQTAIAISKYNGNDETREVIYYKAYQVNQDQSAVQDIIQIIRNFNVKQVTVDNKGGRFAIPQIEKAIGRARLTQFNFSTEKLTGYKNLKELIINNKLKIPDNNEVVSQFRTLSDKLKPISAKDKDDIIDAIMMSVQPTCNIENRTFKVITY